MESEQMAKAIAEMQDQLREQENAKGKNYMLPEPPKPGEIIHCLICGLPMLPKDFNPDPKIRQKEFKWHQHWDCMQACFARCDLETPGLIAERKNGLRAGRQISQHNQH